MPRFSEYFQLNRSQQELDFVDVDTEEDIPVYVDPYAIEVHDDERSALASEYIRSFFDELLKSLREMDIHRAEALMGNLHEPRETFLGVSSGIPKGRGVGRGQASQLIAAIIRSKAYKSGILTDLSEMSMYVEGIDRDKISDLTTNIIRSILVDYTTEQCDLFDIETRDYIGPPLWDAKRRNWRSRKVKLPYVEDVPVILVPKHMVRRKLSLDGQEFYNKQITEFLQAENIKANSSLVQTLKSGEKKVYKTSIHEEYPKSKEFIAEMVNNHPQLLALYKDIARKTSTMSVFDADAPSLSAICLGLADAIKGIKTGSKHADEYHRFVLGALTALFYPNLIQPRKEWEINEGRKRVDIVYTNAGETGFFSQRRNDRNIGANVVIVECKNYSSDVANQEVDQLLGRFDDNRGRMGILTCRAVDDTLLLSRRCRDAAVRKQGFIIVLTDEDIEKMLRCKAALDDRAVEQILHEKFRALLA